MATRAQYITVAPVTPRGKWFVASRRIGSQDRYRFIAECRSEVIADQIVDALERGRETVLAEAAE